MSMQEYTCTPSATWQASRAAASAILPNFSLGRNQDTWSRRHTQARCWLLLLLRTRPHEIQGQSGTHWVVVFTVPAANPAAWLKTTRVIITCRQSGVAAALHVLL